MRTIRVLLLGLVVLVTGCDSGSQDVYPVTPVLERMIGTITGFSPDDPHLSVPDTVQAGEAFTVDVRTYWPTGCVVNGRTEVEYDGLEATVTPIDFQVHGEDCREGQEQLQHAATLRFDRPGEARVIINGRNFPSDSVVRFHHPVVVR